MVSSDIILVLFPLVWLSAILDQINGDSVNDGDPIVSITDLGQATYTIICTSEYVSDLEMKVLVFNLILMFVFMIKIVE